MSLQKLVVIRTTTTGWTHSLAAFWAVGCCLMLSTTHVIAFDGKGGYYDYSISPQVCFTRISREQGLLKRNRGSVSNNSRTRSIQLVCPLFSNYHPSPNSDCTQDAQDKSSYSYSVEFTIRLRPSWSNKVADVQFIKASSKLTDNPAFYRAIDRSPAANDPARWNGSDRYWSWNRRINIFCAQTTASGAANNIDTWAAQVIVTLPPGAQLSQLVSFGGTDM